MKPRIIIILFLLYSVLFSNINKLLQDGYKAMVDKRYSDAVEIYNQVLKLEDRKISAYTNLGLAYYYTNEFALAEQTLLAGLKVEKDNERLLNNLKSVYYKWLSNPDKDNSIKDILNRAIKKYPNDINMYINSSAMLINRKKYSDAKEILILSVNKFPKSQKLKKNLSIVYNNLAVKLTSEKKYEETLKLLIEAQTFLPGSTKLKYLLGYVYMNLDKYKKCLSVWNEINEPGYKEKIIKNKKIVLNNWILNLFNNKKWDALEKIYNNKKYVSIIDNNPDQINLIGLAFSYTGAFEKSLDIFNKAYQKFPDNELLMNNYKYVIGKYSSDLMDEEKYREAVKILTDGIKIFKHESGFYNNASICYSKINKFDESLDIINKGIVVFPEDKGLKVNRKSIIINYVNMLDNKKEYEKEIEIIEIGKKYCPEESYLYQKLGWAYLNSGKKKYSEISHIFKKAMDLYVPVISSTTLPYLLPFKGRWLVSQGNNDTATHFGYSSYAFDFMKVDDDGNTHENNAAENADFFTYGADVYAPYDGEIVEVVNNVKDNKVGELNLDNISGNYVKIKHNEYETSIFAHLKKGSIEVEVGQKVKQGDVIGEVGNSGYSDGPHLHFAILDKNDVTIPMHFHKYYIFRAGVEEYVFQDSPKKGEIVFHDKF